MYLETNQNEEPVILTNVSQNHLTETSKENWLSYWNYFKRHEFNHCAELGCTEEHHYGVLVRRNESKQGKLFVVPVCKKHSSEETKTLHIDSHVDIISADLSL